MRVSSKADELHLPEILQAMGFGDKLTRQMLAEPERALACIHAATRTPGVKVPRAWAIMLFQRGEHPA